MIADNIAADSYLLANLRRDIADDIIAGLFILFDVDSEPDDHSEVLLLFVGCIVNFIVFVSNLHVSSFQRWGTHAATETGIKSQNASPECSIWNSKRCYMGVQTPKMSISHIHTYIYTYFIAIIDRSPCPCWTSPQNKMCNMLPKQRMFETCIKCFKLQTAPQHTHTVFFPCRSNSYGTNALTKSSGVRQIWWAIHIKNAPARDLEQCGG